MPEWSQDQAIAFECARECIVDLMGICSAALTDLEQRAVQNAGAIEVAEQRLADLAGELQCLHVNDTKHVERIRAEYGGMVRQFRATNGFASGSFT